MALAKNNGRVLSAVVLAVTALATSAGFTQNLRSLGIDVSTYQGNITPTSWATLKRATNQQVSGISGDGRDFVMIRSSRGGTTGEDHRQGGYPSGNNTFFSQSCRYDDPYYVQNINQAIAAGLFAGSYHFARPDIIATSVNSDGSPVAGPNTGTDEADHFIQMAGPWMRPGFLLPALDLEAGDGIRTDNQMAQFCVDFSTRIYNVMGFRPAIYCNGNYAANILQTATTPTPAQIVSSFPLLWSARWANQTDPNSIDVQNGQPKDSYTPIYGPWDDAPNPTHPWKIWQYASTAHVNAIGGGSANCDVDVANGGIEFLKDQLVPALWMADADGSWTTLANWNSGIAPTAPVSSPGQLSPIGTQTLPAARLPGPNDTVILDRPNSAVAVTLDSGAQTIRKLFMRETLNITGGSLNINYTPSWDSTNIAAEFSGPVTLSGSGSLTVHTLLVDTTRTFTLNGGTLTANTVYLANGATAAKILVGGDVTFASFTNNATATITNGIGSGNLGTVDLNAGSRTFTVSGSSTLAITAPISNGGLVKAGLGTLRVTAANNYSLGTTVSAGTLLVNNTSGSGTGSGSVTVNGGTLSGVGTISGPVTVNPGGTLYPGPGGTGILTLGSAPTLNGATFFWIDRNGVSPSTKLNLTSGTLNFSGSLVVSNAGATLTGGESFTLFTAPARSGSFASTTLPSLSPGLNWYLGDLVASGSIKVNRAPSVTGPTFTNTPAAPLQIPIASLTAAVSDPDSDSVTLAGITLTSINGVAITTNGAFITYASSGNANDRILYTVTDSHGGIAAGSVSVAASTTGQFLGSIIPANNAISIQFAGGPGSTYYVERSTNLSTWAAVSTNVMPVTGVFTFTDNFSDLTGQPPFAFYRLRW